MGHGYEVDGQEEKLTYTEGLQVEEGQVKIQIPKEVDVKNEPGIDLTDVRGGIWITVLK